MQNPKTSHWQALLHVLHYVYSTQDQEIVLRGTPMLNIHAYSDLD